MIYADYNGSAPLCKEVREYLIERMKGNQFANPNSIHPLGTKLMMGIQKSRAVSARVLGCNPKQIFFNSGSTEGISQIFYSILSQVDPKEKPYIAISGIEHSAISNSSKNYEKKGFKVHSFPTKPNGQVDLEAAQSFFQGNKGKIALCSVMAANNETGVIQPYKEIASLCQDHQVLSFSDTTQFIGKDDFSFEDSGLDFAVLSGHKIGAMTGVGLVIAKDPGLLKEYIIGGGQEKGLRGGTQNYIGIETIAVALDFYERSKAKLEELRAKRDQFESMIKNDFPEVVIIGESAPRLSSTSLMALPGIHGQAVQIELETKDIYVTTSSACSDNSPVTSNVLKSMGVGDSIGRGVVRISLGLCSDPEHYIDIYHALKSSYLKLSKVSI